MSRSNRFLNIIRLLRVTKLVLFLWRTANKRKRGFENACEDEEHYTKWYVLHAEANAIMKVASSTQSCARQIHIDKFCLKLRKKAF